MAGLGTLVKKEVKDLCLDRESSLANGSNQVDKTKEKIKAYLGIDVGSISTNLAVIEAIEDDEYNILKTVYLRTDGNPIEAIKKGVAELSELEKKVQIRGVGTTGSGRKLAKFVAGADIVKTEITAHASASKYFVPDIKTILEIGGQDSKIIILRKYDGKNVVVDYAMNSICAAGCGAFLDHQANRLKIPIEEFGCLALQYKLPVNIAGRCTVFAESDMIHKQQIGHKKEDIIYGLCRAIVRNYISNVAKGKEIRPPIMFQGGVAANKGVKKALEEELRTEVIVPEYYNVMGAIGAAILAKKNTNGETKFRGFRLVNLDLITNSYECEKCDNHCELTEFKIERKLAARWGSRCGNYNL